MGTKIPRKLIASDWERGSVRGNVQSLQNKSTKERKEPQVSYLSRLSLSVAVSNLFTALTPLN